MRHGCDGTDTSIEVLAVAIEEENDDEPQPSFLASILMSGGAGKAAEAAMDAEKGIS